MNRFQNAGPKPESAATDKGVLAWFDEELSQAPRRSIASGTADVRATVAELIEALGEIAASRIEATGTPPVPYLTAEQAWNIARAALARCNGGAA